MPYYYLGCLQIDVVCLLPLQITLITWTEYLCDFLDMANADELCSHIATIKRGHYSLIDAPAKLEILRVLVSRALETDLVRELLDEYIEQWHELGATRRGEALQEARERREEKERSKGQCVSNEDVSENGLMDADKNKGLLSNNHGNQNGEIALKKSNHLPKKRFSLGDG